MRGSFLKLLTVGLFISAGHSAFAETMVGVTVDDVTNTAGVVDSLSKIVKKPTARIVFDFGRSPGSYKAALQQIQKKAFVMGQIADSSEMSNITVAGFRRRTVNYWQTVSPYVDIWEIGNEVNGTWLGTNTFKKIQAGFEEISSRQGKTAMTLFYEGEPTDAVNCIEAPGSDMFSWIDTQFELKKIISLRDPAKEKMRLGLTYVFISWYPDQCEEIKPNWEKVFQRLAAIFPNSKIGFGEIGPAKPQYGSQYEINLIKEFYGMEKVRQFPPNYVGGNFWWHFVSEMVPSTKTPLLKVLNDTISP